MVASTKTHRPYSHRYIQKWRLNAGLTQSQAGEKLELSAPLISRVESGKTQYTQYFIERAAEAYGCTPGQLLDLDPSTASVRREIEKKLLSASEEDLQKCLTILKTILG
ncbi:helix-turn-helix domain-containing protein [Pseudovibrio exalbescens]|uniref:helix-turn-helix domain-containing protein n=1 Tax=Pseudovibrio exalbescens TaxID=197461 RepID=UPI003CC7DD4D